MSLHLQYYSHEELGIFSLTELADLTEHFGAHFDPTERLRHTDITERFS